MQQQKTSHGSAGGGGVNFLGVGNSTDQTITRGGDFVAASSNDSAATAGGGPQGKGGDNSSMGGDRFSTAAVYAAQGSLSPTLPAAGITYEPVVGNVISTPYLGSAPLGRTYAGTTDDEGVGPPDATGILGGGGVLRTTVGTTAQASKQSHAPSGFFRCTWIPSHCGDEGYEEKKRKMLMCAAITEKQIIGNDQADELAKQGAALHQVERERPPPTPPPPPLPTPPPSAPLYL